MYKTCINMPYCDYQSHGYTLIYNLILFRLVCVSALRKTHHIKDDHNTRGKHIREAGECDRAVSLSFCLSVYVCVCLCVLSISHPHYMFSLFLSLSLTLSLSVSPSQRITATTTSCHLKNCLQLLSMSDNTFSAMTDMKKYEKPGVNLSVGPAVWEQQAQVSSNRTNSIVHEVKIRQNKPAKLTKELYLVCL